ncbi:hypothetical protein GWI33_009307 [Rhynchophorus ferrugineus]|uniref:Uncharacterized protein n=1 Tax=Rhynchophorus ferrugineus TaxID=354439 RepID=A0A834MDJ6_RHYFE|nr:hypothetical protein GWI33_009307 [Rhynchophorus ferrugineus]
MRPVKFPPLATGKIDILLGKGEARRKIIDRKLAVVGKAAHREVKRTGKDWEIGNVVPARYGRDCSCDVLVLREYGRKLADSPIILQKTFDLRILSSVASNDLVRKRYLPFLILFVTSENNPLKTIHVKFWMSQLLRIFSE